MPKTSRRGRGRSGKRPRYQEPPIVHAANIVQQYEATVKAENQRFSAKGRRVPPTGLSFNAIYKRPMNSSQEAKHNEYLKFCVDAFELTLDELSWQCPCPMS